MLAICKSEPRMGRQSFRGLLSCCIFGSLTPAPMAGLTSLWTHKQQMTEQQPEDDQNSTSSEPQVNVAVVSERIRTSCGLPQKWNVTPSEFCPDGTATVTPSVAAGGAASVAEKTFAWRSSVRALTPHTITNAHTWMRSSLRHN